MVSPAEQRSTSRMLLVSGIACMLHAPIDLYLADESDWLTLLSARAAWLAAFVVAALIVQQTNKVWARDAVLHSVAAGSVVVTGFVILRTGGSSSPLLMWLPMYPALTALVVPFDFRTVSAMTVVSVLTTLAIPFFAGDDNAQIAWTVSAVTLISGLISLLGSSNAIRRRDEELEVRAEMVRVEAELERSEATRALLEESVRLKQLATLGGVTAGLADELQRAASALRVSLDRPGGDDLETRHVGERIERLVSDVVRAADVERGVGRVDVAVAIDAAARLTRSVWERFHAVELEAEPGLYARMGRGPLTQVLMNLILNAVEATPYGGRIRVSARPTPAGVVVRVDDDGPGIPQARRAGSLRPFEGTKRAGGLGLTLSRAFVTEAGGTLRLGAAPAGGARVELVLIPAPESQVEVVH